LVQVHLRQNQWKTVRALVQNRREIRLVDSHYNDRSACSSALTAYHEDLDFTCLLIFPEPLSTGHLLCLFWFFIFQFHTITKYSQALHSLKSYLHEAQLPALIPCSSPSTFLLPSSNKLPNINRSITCATKCRVRYFVRSSP
jgi:hypothetical protein